MRRLLVLLVLTACTSHPDPPALGTAAQDAARACVRLRLVAQGVQANAAAADVRADLAEARRLAGSAAVRDQRWVALSGGIAALDEAVARDDGAAAATGLRVALAECRAAG
ncbi:MAG: hypothetical protein LC789_12905 [Actinobacteria bacterium]|nr:hypothetical protein [Actinomycetota bacterium]